MQTVGLGKSCRFLLGAACLLLGGCASVDPEFADPHDPYEDFNRAVFRFNTSLDEAVLRPVGQGYNAVVPEPVNRGVSNFFNNLGDAGSAVNNLLQFKVERSASDVGRVFVNTLFGLGGLVDVATEMNLPRHAEDFGQTLGTWGVASGPYLVLPLLGPSSGRDAVGTVVDWFTDPVAYVESDTSLWGLNSLNLIDTRADLEAASRVLDQGAVDPYAFVRDAYLQKRENAVYDGNPPALLLIE